MKKNNPSGYGTRCRRRKIEPGVYRKIKSGKLLVIDDNNEYHIGHVCVRKKGGNRYEYARWRSGAKIKEKYLGALLNS
ncbi:MAG: hypothetical protein ABIJ15_07080 [bacterium]